MATRRPLTVDINKDISVLEAADVLLPQALGTGTPDATKVLSGAGIWVPRADYRVKAAELTLNFGAVATYTKQFVITGLTGLLPGDPVVVMPMAFSDAELEQIVYVARCDIAGSLKVIANSNSRVKGVRKLYLFRLGENTPPSIVSSKIRYVSTTGDDGTAVAGDISKPYGTVRAAVDAASAGDTVCLLPGSHSGTGPLILKKNMVLRSLLPGYATATEIVFDPSFVFQLSTATGTTQHGGNVQPATGVAGVDACFVRGLTLRTQYNTINNALIAVTGVNTAAGTSLTGTGASYCDMYVEDCTLIGTSDVHITIDAVQFTYFKRCRLSSGYDFCHLIGPNNTAQAVMDDCQLLYRPYRQTSPLFIGSRPDTLSRVQSGTLALNNCELFVYNDGLTDWSSLTDSFSAGFVVDDKAGAKLIVENLRRTVLSPFPKFIFGFASGVAVGSPSRGTVVVSGTTSNLLDYNTSDGNYKSPVCIVAQNDMVVHAKLFAATTESDTQANTYRATAAAGVQTFSLFTLPANGRIKSVWIDVRTLFSGGAGSATTIEIGTAAVPDKYLTATTVRGSLGNVSSGPLMAIEVAGDPFAITGTLIVATLRNTGANVSTLTAGTVIVYVELAGIAN